jgi:hypothetical protein
MTNNSRSEIREREINEEIKQLNKKVSMFTNVSWGFVALGFIVVFIGIFFGEFKGFHEFGDFIGGSVGSIWSLAGLFFVYVAFLGQKQSILNQQMEILHNQEELRATREELAGQKKQMELQNATLKQQQFENTFFQLFNSHQRFNENMKFVHNETTTGIEALNKYYNAFFEMVKQKPTKDAFNKIEKRYNHTLSPYLNQIEQLLLLIDGRKLDNKDYYVQLVKSIIPHYGRLLLLYAAISGKRKNLEELLIKYQLIQDIDILDEDLVNKEDRRIFKNKKIL